MQYAPINTFDNPLLYNQIFSEISKNKKWSPAIIETARELENIKVGSRALTNKKSFWIGGSSNAPGNAHATISFAKYIKNEKGTLFKIVQLYRNIELKYANFLMYFIV